MENLHKTKNKNKLVLMIVCSIVLVATMIGGTIFYFWNISQKGERAATAVAEDFTNALSQRDFGTISELTTSDSLKKAGYTKTSLADKYLVIFDGIGAKNIKITNVKVTPIEKQDGFTMTYTLNMETDLGKLKEEKYEATLESAGDGFLVDWNAHLIFPEMEPTDKINITTTRGLRGSIIDRNSLPLALLAEYPEVGIIPKELGEGTEREASLQAISEKFAISVENLESKLTAEWVTPELYVPIKVWAKGDTPVMKGVQYASKEMRSYPINQAAAHLIGYVGEVSAEDIDKNPSLKVGDVIGKSGLEATFEKRLRGKDGGRIVINDQDGNLKKVLQEAEKKDGETIKLTIDSKLQKQTFDQLSDTNGSAVIMNPQDGSLLALVSTPSYDPNLMTAGISSKEYEAYANNENLPFLARYASGYAPGSTFKTITAGIGLDAGITKADKTRDISGLKWQENKSWGNYFVTRVSDVSPVNMNQALIYSDNIYFAQEGLEMGQKTFEAGLSKFVFGEKLDVPIAMDPAQVANKSGLNTDILLADTAYGQGQLLMNPIQQAVSYSPFANSGMLVYPKLTEDQKTAKSKQAIKAESAALVKEAMIQVVEDPNGTARSLAIPGRKIAAKTGTAELKEEQDTKGKENGFLLALDADKNSYLMVAMIEGQSSHVVIEKMKPVLQTIYGAE
ncbi:penicillin-binding protein PBP4(5) [Carnobacterium gallinarum]|uniref:penicillin-binding protein PBP4(5) n=1 Tax=Carnobacterium gallinarum TaxID=2749 RepID=UPI000552B297|nr:penicillin-binding transpeptidase domain-containing protein [Carnobacterium gallinarum]